LELFHKQVDLFLHNCANEIWNFKRLEGPPLFALIIFLIKNFNYAITNASILHLKLGDSGELGYFPTSTP
jgi:hypothetical protein